MRKTIMMTILVSVVGFSTVAFDVHARRIKGRVVSGDNGEAGVFVTARDNNSWSLCFHVERPVGKVCRRVSNARGE